MSDSTQLNLLISGATVHTSCQIPIFLSVQEVFEEYKVDTTPVFLFFKNDAKVSPASTDI